MNQLFLGSIGTGVTDNIKNAIACLKEKVIILDFNNEYDEIDGNVIYLDKANPILGSIDIDDVKAINAGYLARSRCLLNKSQEILKETKTQNKENLIEEAVERLQISWDNAENMYGKILNQKMHIKKNRAHVPSDRFIEEILENKVTILKAKNMHSDHLRGVTFAILSRLSRMAEENIYIVADELVSFFSQGNTKMFFESVNFNTLNFLFSYNKASIVPVEIVNIIDTFHLHRINSPSELKFLKEMGLQTKRDLQKLDNDVSLIVEKQHMAHSL